MTLLNEVSWNEAYIHRRFSKECIKLVMSCVRNVQFSLLLNGSVYRIFKLGCGLRQGDSIFLFLKFAVLHFSPN